jgi:hypothetical protein
VLLYGQCGGELVFIPEARAEELARIWGALHAAKSWGEFRHLAGTAAYGDLVERMLDSEELERRPRRTDPFDSTNCGRSSTVSSPALCSRRCCNRVAANIVQTFGRRGGSAERRPAWVSRR